MKKRVLALLLALFLLPALAGCGKRGQSANTESKVESNMLQFKTPEDSAPVAVMHTNKGDVSLVLFPEQAPKTVENFLTHAKNGYYDGIIFHRVIEDFMIQGGDPTGTGRGGESIWGQPFADEFSADLRNFRGALSMANAGPGTNGSQFFIVTCADVGEDMLGQMKAVGWPDEVIDTYKQAGGTPYLDGKHTVFGQVIDGMDVVDDISKTQTGAQDKPVHDVVIESIDVTTYGEAK